MRILPIIAVLPLFSPVAEPVSIERKVSNLCYKISLNRTYDDVEEKMKDMYYLKNSIKILKQRLEHVNSHMINRKSN